MIATFLWYVVLQAHEVSKQVLFTYLIPIFAAVFAFLMLGEVLTPVTMLLGAMIILGIALAEISFKNQNNNIKNNKQLIK
jgi:drug/metabolite transporter (DMT)-like permease